jgi:3-hydroxy acid dehydrogenase/malonic semialdehyde reductase
MLVLITGATAGFGAAMAGKFVQHGHRVIATVRRKERLSQLADELGGALQPLEMDVTNRSSIEQALATLSDEWQQIDVLVNNAGLALGVEPAHGASLDEWDTMIDTNCKGLATVTHMVLPAMIERGRGLSINIGSVAGTYPCPGGNVYGATKAFVDQFTRILGPRNPRADLVVTGVRPPISLQGCPAERNFPMRACGATIPLPPRYMRAHSRCRPKTLRKPPTGSPPCGRTSTSTMAR